MSNLLFELYSENSPTNIQQLLSYQIKYFFKYNFNHNFLYCINIKNFFTSNRIILIVSNIPLKLKILNKSLRGPKVNSSKLIFNMFLKKYNIHNVCLITIRCNYYFFEFHRMSKLIYIFFRFIIKKLFIYFYFLKFSRWGIYRVKWIRPVYSFVYITNSKKILLNFKHIYSNQVIFFNIKNYSSIQYFKVIYNMNIILSQKKRKRIFFNEANTTCIINNVFILPNTMILKKIISTLESPYIIILILNKTFAYHLPKEILFISLQLFQDFFFTKKFNFNFSLLFIIISNVIKDLFNNNIIFYILEILNSIFSSIKFLYNKNLKTNLIFLFIKLKILIFHYFIGSYFFYISYLRAITFSFLSQNIMKKKVTLLLLLLKSDYNTNLVSEIYHFKGIYGYYIASNNCINPNILDTIKNHHCFYSLALISDIILFLSEKISTLNLMFGIYPHIRGSKDPYHLRSISFDIIKLICNKKLYLSFAKLLKNEVVFYLYIRSYYILSSYNILSFQYILNSLLFI